MKKNIFVFFLLLASLTIVQAQEMSALFTSDFSAEEFINRRANIIEEIGKDSFALIQGAPEPHGYVKFRQNNEFYYLCGIEAPHAYLLIDGATGTSSLYLKSQNPRLAAFEGNKLTAKDETFIKKACGVDAVYDLDHLQADLKKATDSGKYKNIFTLHSPAEGLAVSRSGARRADMEIKADPLDGRISREQNLVQILKSQIKTADVEFQVETKDLTAILDKQRLIKSPAEIALIKKATYLSGLALIEAMKASKPGIYEYELDAVAKYVYWKFGAQGDAYSSIVASGKNAMTPHYFLNSSEMKDGDLVLMDYAPDYHYYMSDLTRQWPVNGKFTADQKELYTFYLACYHAISKRIRPGVTPKQVITEAYQEMEKVFLETKFSKKIYTDNAGIFIEGFRKQTERPFVMLGHWVGMSTHDVGGYTNIVLKPGMVFTIEPQFVIPEEKIYIRIEDLFIITEDGAEMVSDFVPDDIEEIETLMKNDGLLQQYPAYNNLKEKLRN